MMVSSPASHRPDYSRSLNEVVRTVGRAGARARYSTPGKLPDALLTLVNQLDDQQKRMLGVVRLFVLSRCNNSVSKEYLEPTRPVAAVESKEADQCRGQRTTLKSTHTKRRRPN